MSHRLAYASEAFALMAGSSPVPAQDAEVLFGIGSKSDQPEFSRLAANCPLQVCRSAKPRQVLLRAGESLRGLPVLLEGWAVGISRLSDGRRQILSFLLPGDLISAHAAFSERLSFSVEAVTAVRYSYYDRKDLVEQLSSDPRTFNALIRSFIVEREKANQLAVDLGCRSAHERVARLILHLHRRLKQRDLVFDDSFDVPLRQQHIADATGLTAVHVNRVLGSLRHDGIVEVADGRWKILDYASLERLADLR